MQLARSIHRPRLFYGWYIVVVALLSQFIAAGTQVYAIGLFLKPMTHEFGWSREAFSAVQTFSTVVMGGIGLVLGGLLDRRGPRLLMLLGATITGSMLICTSLVQNLWQFYLVRGFAQTVGDAMIGNLVVNVTVSKWFVARRGMAISIASVGISLGGVLMAPLVGIWIQAYGWRVTWVLLGIMTWALVFPAALLMRRTPEDYGLMPDGMSPDEAAAYSGKRKGASAVAEQQWTRQQAVRTRAIWLVIFAYGTANIGLGALLLHLISFLTDNGFSRGTAAILFSSLAWASTLSKPFWGALMDRFHARHLSAVGFIVAGSSITIMLLAASLHSAGFMLSALALYGFAIGGTLALQETVWASYFGRLHLGQIRSVAMPFSILFGAGGPLLAGTLYDRSGNYQSALFAFAAFYVVGCVLVLLARPPRLPASPPATPSGPSLLP